MIKTLLRATKFGLQATVVEEMNTSVVTMEKSVSKFVYPTKTNTEWQTIFSKNLFRSFTKESW